MFGFSQKSVSKGVGGGMNSDFPTNDVMLKWGTFYNCFKMSYGGPFIRSQQEEEKHNYVSGE